MNTPKSLMEAAKEQAKHEDSDGYFGFLTGVEWLFGHLCELSEFDEEAVRKYFAHYNPPSFIDRAVEGARHQHTLDQAALLKAREELLESKMEKIELADALENNGAAKAIRECVDENDKLTAELEAAKQEISALRSAKACKDLYCDQIEKEMSREIERLNRECISTFLHEQRMVEAQVEIARLKDSLYFVGGFGCDVPASLYGGMTAIEFMKKIGLPQGARDVAGMEVRCYGEAKSAIATLYAGNFAESAALRALVKELEAALSICHDELVEHYNKAKCFHCNSAIEEAKEALKGSGVMG